MNESEIINRGAEANRLLSNPILQDAFALVKEGIVTSMGNSALGDKETHNRLVIALQLLQQVEKRIKEVIETGKLTHLQIEQKRLFGLFK